MLSDKGSPLEDFDEASTPKKKGDKVMKTTTIQSYPALPSTKVRSSDITDKEWKLLEPLFPRVATEGRPRQYDLREIINGILYVQKKGCSWRMMPCDLPEWQSVYRYFRQWRNDGTWERIISVLYRLHRVGQIEQT